VKAKEVVRVTTVISTDPVTAFSIFTEEIGLWWKPKVSHLFREGQEGVLKFDPGPNGRLLEVYAGAPNDPFEVGRVLTWIPGHRLVFEWRQFGFGPNDLTRVDIRFEAEGNSTRVTLEHLGWDSIPPGNLSRHGWSGQAFASMIGVRWGDALTSLRAHVSTKSSS
jgi:uncharacterized protein YndB with AHSA1/START domain